METVERFGLSSATSPDAVDPLRRETVEGHINNFLKLHAFLK